MKPTVDKKQKEIESTIKGIFWIIAIPIIIYLVMCDDNETDDNNNEVQEDVYQANPLNMGDDSLKKWVGQSTPFELWSVWGSPETLEGTTNKYWIIFLPKANISMVTSKSDQKVMHAELGRGAANYLIKFQKERIEIISECFSPWNGSHMALRDLVKSNMNDPDSFDHVETIYFDKQDHLIVNMTYRGKNAFGGVVREFVKAKVDINSCVVLDILEHR